MKILLAAPKDKTVLGMITFHSLRALKSLGHEVNVFDFRLKPYSENKLISTVKNIVRPLMPRLPSLYDIPSVKKKTDSLVNQRLMERLDLYKPDLLLVFCGENISAETINAAHQKGIVTVNWFHDSLLYASRQALVNNILPAYDHCFLVDSLDVLAAAGVVLKQAQTLPLACDPLYHQKLILSPEDKAIYGSDIAFVGTLSARRETVLEVLRGLDLKIWGVWNKKSDRIKDYYAKRNIAPEETLKIYNASRLVVDIHSLFNSSSAAGKIYNVTPRVFEVPACGGFLLTNDIAQLEHFYLKDTEMAVYKTIEELRSKVEYFLAHEEERLAMCQKAYQRAHNEYTYEKRLKDLIKAIG